MRSLSRDSSRTILNSQGVVDSGFPIITYSAINSGTVYLDISAGVNSASKIGNYGISVYNYGADTALDTASTSATLSTVVITYCRINGVSESGSFDTSIDHDWLAVSLIAGHHYTFSAQTVSQLADNLNDLAIDLRDSSRTTLNGQGVVDGGANRTASFTYTATSSGIEYLDISAGSSTPTGLVGNYQVSVTDNTDTVLDTASTNATLALYWVTSGTIDAIPESGSFDTSIDHDWFAVSLIAGHDYSFWATGTSLHDVASALRDSSRTILNSQGVVDDAFAYTATSSGTEYLDISAGVDNSAGPTGSYQITALDLGADTALDTASTNASLMMEGLANSGRINGTPESGSFDTSLDHDWWAVSLVAGHTYTFSAEIVAATSDTLNEVAIDLRDSSRTILNSQGVVDAGPVFQTRFTYTAISSGTKYLDISAGGSNPASLIGNYQVFVTDDGGSDTVLDTASTTASLSFGGDANLGALDAVPESGSFDTSIDHDWFAVNLTAGHDYAFSAESLSGIGNVAIVLRDSSRAILDSQGVVDGALASFNYTAIGSGTEYLDISAVTPGRTGNYAIFVSDLGADTVLDTASTSANLTMGGTTAGRINAVPESGSFDSSLDHDWLAVNLVAGHVYTFSAQAQLGTFNEKLNDVAIDLRDSGRTILDSQGVVDAGPHAISTFTYTATTSGTEYLDISAGGSTPAGVTGGYQVTVTDNGLASPTHLTINLIYDADALAAPQSFRDGMQAAANMLEGAFDDKITINIAVGYTEFGASR